MVKKMRWVRLFDKWVDEFRVTMGLEDSQMLRFENQVWKKNGSLFFERDKSQGCDLSGFFLTSGFSFYFSHEKV